MTVTMAPDDLTTDDENSPSGGVCTAPSVLSAEPGRVNLVRVTLQSLLANAHHPCHSPSAFLSDEQRQPIFFTPATIAVHVLEEFLAPIRPPRPTEPSPTMSPP